MVVSLLERHSSFIAFISIVVYLALFVAYIVLDINSGISLRELKEF